MSFSLKLRLAVVLMLLAESLWRTYLTNVNKLHFVKNDRFDEEKVHRLRCIGKTVYFQVLLLY